MKVEVWVEVNPTEDEEKVRKALLNVFNPTQLRVEESNNKKFLVAIGYGPQSLMKIYRLIKEQGIEDSARAIISRVIVSDNKIVFQVHKQAAYVGVLSFVTEGSESPLGPITFIIETNNVRQLIDWLCPRTIKVKRVYEGEPPTDP